MSSNSKLNAPSGKRLRWFSGRRREIRARFLASLLSTPSLESTEKLRRLLGQLVLLRVAIISSFLGTAAWRIFESGQNAAYLSSVFTFIGTTFLVSAINAVGLRFSSRLVLFGYTQFLVDIVLVTCTVVLSGSGMSHLLYLLAILGAAVTFQRHGAVIVAALSGVAYAIVESGILPGSALVPTTTQPHEIFLSYLSFIVIALVGAYLAEQAQTFGRIANAQAKDIDALNQKQQMLVNDSSEGIVMLDARGYVTSINSAARTMFGLGTVEAERLFGRALSMILKDLGFSGGEALWHKGSCAEEEQSITLINTHGLVELHLSYLLRPIESGKKEGEGRLLMFRDVSRVKDMEERLALHERMAQLLNDQNEPPKTFDSGHADIPIIGDSGVMNHVFSLIERVAASEASILITGESGTGKELVARTIHEKGPRRMRHFVAINCGAIPENLIESELFGHKKGSFTGAVNDSLGLFRQASNGTIFLDEIGELPLPMQTKLLRVLQERKVRPVGEVHDVSVDVRIIAATNRDLRKEIAHGRFREDLFYRLNVVNIMIPPLRERREDIPLLVRHFIGKYCDPDSIVPKVSPEAIQLLMNHTFPGNIRELENVIERALVLGGHAILPEHLPEEFRHSKSERNLLEFDGKSGATKILLLPVDLDAEISKLERELLFRALETTGGMKKQAAELLGLNFRSFRYRLKKYGVADNSAGEGEDELSQDS